MVCLIRPATGHFDVCAAGIAAGLAFADVAVTRTAVAATGRIVYKATAVEIGRQGRTAEQQQGADCGASGDAADADTGLFCRIRAAGLIRPAMTTSQLRMR